MLTEKDFPSQKYWLLKPLIIWSAILAFVRYSFSHGSAPLPISPNATDGLILAAGLVILSIPTLSLFTLKYSLDDNFFAVQQGFFNTTRGNFFYNKIQDVSIQQGLFDRVLGLYTVSIENASMRITNPRFRASSMLYNTLTVGFKNNRVLIPGLSQKDAMTLKEELLKRMHQS
ncbi:MAG: Bacterial domain [Gammaproteobacteria bacterium]|jgi:uncharacterized membrane protein YdbT with pleckstrin-like domain|nr:Bacterial domain [Gammaproteobacteria bacterium]